MNLEHLTSSVLRRKAILIIFNQNLKWPRLPESRFGPCWDRDHLNERSVQVAIRDLVLDSAWGWPITAFEFDIALDVEAANNSRTMKHELKKNYGPRFGFGSIQKPTGHQMGCRNDALWRRGN